MGEQAKPVIYTSNIDYSTENYLDRNNPEIRKAKVELLKEAYSPNKRKTEILVVTVFCVLLPLALYNLLAHFTLYNFIPAVLGGLVGILFADFASGVAHWGADTWGHLSTPFIGPTFIRSFREHHVSPTTMCNHDIIETNADNCMLILPTLYLMATKDLMLNSPDAVNPSSGDMFWTSMWIMTAVGVALTNQIHKWAHSAHLPQYVQTLQKYHIILPKKVHSVHHKPAFDGYYCITTGWLNPVLDGCGFWKKIENVVHKVTGAIPREDDYQWTGLVSKSPAIVTQYLNSKKSPPCS